MFMERETDTDKILRAIAGIHDEVGDIREALQFAAESVRERELPLVAPS